MYWMNEIHVWIFRNEKKNVYMMNALWKNTCMEKSIMNISFDIVYTFIFNVENILYVQKLCIELNWIKTIHEHIQYIMMHIKMIQNYIEKNVMMHEKNIQCRWK